MDEVKRELHVGKLVEFYRCLLTDKQYEILSMYYGCDCTLTEVAENLGILRQSVYDCVKKCTAELEEYERELGRVRLFDALEAALAAPDEELRGKIEQIVRSF